MTSRLVPSKPDGDDAPILSVDVEDAGAVMNASPAASTQSASKFRRAWERIEKRMWGYRSVL